MQAILWCVCTRHWTVYQGGSPGPLGDLCVRWELAWFQDHTSWTGEIVQEVKLLPWKRLNCLQSWFKKLNINYGSLLGVTPKHRTKNTFWALPGMAQTPRTKQKSRHILLSKVFWCAHSASSFVWFLSYCSMVILCISLPLPSDLGKRPWEVLAVWSFSYPHSPGQLWACCSSRKPTMEDLTI